MIEPDNVTFDEFLRRLAKGEFNSRLTDALRDIVQGVTEHNKKGKLTLTIEIEPDKNSEGVLGIQPTLKAEVPQAGFRKQIYFADDEGGLSRANRGQTDIEDSSEARERKIKAVH